VCGHKDVALLRIYWQGKGRIFLQEGKLPANTLKKLKRIRVFLPNF
jgi:hypothetical protein